MTRSVRFGLIAPPLGAALAGFGAYFAADHSCDAGHPGLARLLFLLVAVVGLGLTVGGIVTSLRAWGVSAPTERSDIIPDQEGINAFLEKREPNWKGE